MPDRSKGTLYILLQKNRFPRGVWSRLRKWLWCSRFTSCNLAFSGGVLQYAAHLPGLMVSVGFHMLRGDPQFEAIAQARLEGWRFCLKSGQTELCNEARVTPALAASFCERQIHPTRQKDRNELLNFLMIMVKAPHVQHCESSKHLRTTFIRWKIAVSSQWILLFGQS